MQSSQVIASIVKVCIHGLSVLLAAYVIPGIKVKNFFHAIIVALFLAILNYTIKPIMTLLSLPITILTFGLFLLVINALCVMLASVIVPKFGVKDFWAALLFGIVVSIFNYVLEIFLLS